MFNNFKRLREISRSKLSDDEFYDEDSDGRGIIDVGAENYDDIFSYYDLEGENVLDKEFDEFLCAKADAIPVKQELSIHFHIKDANEKKAEEIDRMLKNNYKRELRALNRKLHNNTMYTVYMVILAIISLAVYIPAVIFEVNHFVLELIEIVLWVFCWQIVENTFMARRTIQQERVKMYRLLEQILKCLNIKRKRVI